MTAVSVAERWGTSAELTHNGGERASDCCPDRRLLLDTCKNQLLKFHLGSTVRKNSVCIKHQFILINASMRFGNKHWYTFICLPDS